MMRKVAQFWLLLVFIVLALGLQYYTEIQTIEVSENAKTITIGLPILEQAYTVQLFVYSIALFLLAAALSTIHFGFELFRKGRIIKRLERQLADASPATSSYGTTTAPAATAYGSATDLDDA